MYLLLLVFGAVLAAAGIVLAASGVSLYDRAFDASVVTPGVVAAVGGLLLIGLGLALRVLQRIEEALAARPGTRAMRPGEAAEPIGAGPSEAGRVAFPTRTVSRLQSASAAAPAAATASETREGGIPEKIPAMVRLESARVIEETELLLAPASSSAVASTSVDAAVAEVDKGRLARRKNGPGATRVAPRLDLSVRPAASSERPPGPAFDTLWPKGPRPVRTAPTASAPAAAAAPTVVEPEQKSEPVPEPAQTLVPDEAPAPQVTVLKSGMVDGMAYTLYSDGSIEAQLPQGTLRFGSITELRNHIEQSA